MQILELTELENKVIKAYMADDFVNDKGWDDPESGTWRKGFHRDCGMGGKTFSGTISSLVKKGWIWTDGDEWFGLTQKAIDILKKMGKVQENG